MFFLQLNVKKVKSPEEKQMHKKNPPTQDTQTKTQESKLYLTIVRV